MKTITPCLWFDHQAEKAVQFYSTVFKNSKIGKISRYGQAGSEISGQKAGSVLTASIQIEDLEVTFLNGGPLFEFTPALSFFVSCKDDQEINETWAKLSQGGTVRMALDKYPWAEKYGWTTDQFGVEWQVIIGQRKQKIAPSFLFVDALFGKGEEALNFYLFLFPHSKIETMARDESTHTILHCAFTLNGLGFTLMEGKGQHGYEFTPASSLIVNCESQSEIDHYWEKLSAGGSPGQCGWLTDKYGVSWQIVPTGLGALMTNPEKSEKVMRALLKMKKLDIAALTRAAE